MLTDRDKIKSGSGAPRQNRNLLNSRVKSASKYVTRASRTGLPKYVPINEESAACLTTYAKAELEGSVSQRLFAESSSRRIGERMIPSIEYNEPLMAQRPYSSSQTAKKYMGLAHRK